MTIQPPTTKATAITSLKIQVQINTDSREECELQTTKNPFKEKC